MIQYLFGDDTFTARKKIHEESQNLAARIRFVDKEDVVRESVEGLFDHSRGSLLGRTLVVLQDPSSYPEEVRDRILAHCDKAYSGNVVLWDRNVDKRLTFYKKVKQLVLSEEFQQPKTEDAMVAWVTAYAPEIPRSVLAELIARVGCDVWAAVSEIDKLQVLSQSEKTDALQYVPQRAVGSATAFPLLDAIVRKQQQLALRLLGEMLDDGASERFILAMLAYQFRLFLSVRIGKDANEPLSAIHEKTGFHSVAIQKAMPGVAHLDVSMISEILSKIAAAEKSLITTTMDARSIVTMLIIGLCR